jgi:hypothetical protein
MSPIRSPRAIVDGKPYPTHSREALTKWRQNSAENIAHADRNRPKSYNDEAMYDGFPNLAPSNRAVRTAGIRGLFPRLGGCARVRRPPKRRAPAPR